MKKKIRATRPTPDPRWLDDLTAATARLCNVTIREANGGIAAGQRLEAAVVLFQGIPSDRQRLVIRQLWRLVPRPQRKLRLFRPARRYAPKVLRGLRGVR